MPDHIELEDVIEQFLEKKEGNQNESKLESSIQEQDVADDVY